MTSPESNSGESKQVAEAALEDIDPRLVNAVRNPQFHSRVLLLEELILNFILIDNSPIFKFPCFGTPYLTDIACILARYYGLEPVSAEDRRVFLRGTPDLNRMPLRTLSSIPPTEPEFRGIIPKEREAYHRGMARFFDEPPERINSSVVLPSLEQMPQPRPEAAEQPSNSVAYQNQDVVHVPRQREDDGRSERPNFKARLARYRRTLIRRRQRRNRRLSL